MTAAPPIIVGQTKKVAIDSIRPHPANARVHDMERLRASVRDHGAFNIVGVQTSTRRILYGEGRWRAMKAEGMKRVAIVELDVDDAEALEILAVDNGSSDAATYDPRKLTNLLEQIRKKADPGRAGFSPAELSARIERLRRGMTDRATSDDTEATKDPIRPPERPVTKAGDVWLLGQHRVLCGDCRNPDHVALVLDGASVHVAFTSPPYADRREYDESSGFRPIPPDEYVEWFAPVSANVAAHLADDGSWFVNIKAGADGLDTELYVLDLVAAHAREWGWHWLTELAWERNGVPKQVVLRFKNQFEPVYQFVRGRPKVRADNVRLISDAAIVPYGPGRGNTSWADPDSAVVSQGERGDLFEGQRGPKERRKRKNGDTTWGRPGPDGEIRQGHGRNAIPTDLPDPDVMVAQGLAYPGNRLPTFAGTHEATGHAAAFPVGLPAWFVKAYSDPGDNVFDPFLGSGSTLLAAHQEDRTGFGIELSPAYVDVICRRFERTTGIVPVLERTGKARSFERTTGKASKPADDPGTASKRQGRGGRDGDALGKVKRA